ncbi:MAG: M23 family metallopeptidase [Candidatus Pacebacteria bacterium]|nr:M23 family metallopeptidase [Candidatus Paceibacterota bacterium]
MMKISLFYKPSIIKVCSVLLMTSFIAGNPLIADANWITDFFTGGKVQASDEGIIEVSSIAFNSQNIDLFNSESAVNPDRKNSSEASDMLIVQDDSFIYTESLFVPDAKFEKSSISEQISVYTVEKNDTLSEIAEKFNISTNTIRWENNISGQTIKEGQKLNILPVTGVKHIVKSGDTLGKIVDKYDAEMEDVEIFNGILKGDALKPGDIIFVPNGIIKPVVVVSTKTSVSSKTATVASNTKVQSGYYIRPTTGIVTSPYGPRRGGFHYGVDIGNKRGTPIVAAASGIVVKVISGCVEGNSRCGGGYGNYIEIQHSNGTKTTYAHLGKVSVKYGQTVSVGGQIGTIGNTGRSTGPHLHFEIENINGSKMRPSF